MPKLRTNVKTLKRVWRFGVPITVYAVIGLIPRPITVGPEGWRLFGLFAATIAALILQPLPGGAVVLIALTLGACFCGIPVKDALGGFGDPVVWLVMAAFFISNALIKTGLARRSALFFVRIVGNSSLGICYALSMTDLVLAAIIPSSGARSGGVVLPIVRSIAELYGSVPGTTGARLGSFLMTGVYQSICVTAAMYMTGQASNPLAAQIAMHTFHFPVTWVTWFIAGIVPGLVSLAAVPAIVFHLNPPEIRHTPEAAAFAAEELRRMGPMNRGQVIVSMVFAAVCGLWIFSPLDITLSAMMGSAALLLTGILTWEDVIGNRLAWDIFVWYGGLYQLSKALTHAGLTTAFANGVGGIFHGAGWPAVFCAGLLIYFYAHYGFASITAHILAMFAVFGSVVIAAGAPVGLVTFAFATYANFAAGLTNYGTVPSPMFFAHGYVTLKEWWKIGFVVSIANLAIWSTVGFAWWKWLGIW